ncbi:alanine racemase [Thermocrinis minervae]|uniref:Alanine racemase n=1 Tax=Thermocrinis minervae TaxID=381751 RepID=A0A1M6S4K6_9AQUI|nr:alanine racemase [Thermocrinis minervae]SHK39635.1 alanine racemase [Thermocrinis minervae]
MSRAVLEISKEAIRHNARALSSYSGKKVIAVIKANGYGVGAVQMASILEDMPEVEGYAVACVEEGIELRKEGFRKKILVLGGVLKGEEKAFLEYELTPVISHAEHLKAIESVPIKFQLKYDTGMGRLGFFKDIVHDPRVEGILTHLSSPLDKDFSLAQIVCFERIIKHYPKLPYVHLESSAGVVYKVPWTTHIRIGLALHGEKPFPGYPIELKRALTLKARILSVKELPKGFPVSYSRTYITDKPKKVGVVAFGYADGLHKVLSNIAHLYYKGKPVKILGNITMDMTMVDLDGTDAKVGDWVHIVCEQQSFTDLARLAGTIPYELMCNLSNRIRRVLLDEERILNQL